MRYQGKKSFDETIDLTVENTLVVDKKIENKSAPKPKTDSAPKIENATIDNIPADTITATAVNALPDKTTPKAVPIALGILSGVGILYLVAKFIIK
jgi:hypothetical protein